MGNRVKWLTATVLCTLFWVHPAFAQRTLGEALRGRALSRVIVVSGTDGFQVVYAIAEVDAAFTDQIILLADRRDDGPLLPDTGPLQLVVPHDKRPARWVRQVAKVEVRDVK